MTEIVLMFLMMGDRDKVSLLLPGRIRSWILFDSILSYIFLYPPARDLSPLYSSLTRPFVGCHEEVFELATKTSHPTHCHARRHSQPRGVDQFIRRKEIE